MRPLPFCKGVRGLCSVPVKFGMLTVRTRETLKIKGKTHRTISLHPDDSSIVQVIDQRALPHRFVLEDLRTPEEAATAISGMHVRGAPLIGVTAAYGLYLAALKVARAEVDEGYILRSSHLLKATRPTAVNLAWAVDRIISSLNPEFDSPSALAEKALQLAEDMAEEEVERCRAIGEHGLDIIRSISARKGGAPVEVLTHCNAGWLACIDWGTATSPIYQAAAEGIAVHVWVDETRPRNQGAALTAWELLENQIPHTVIVDNAGGHLMQHGMVDCVIVGADRVTRRGDAANKIGTYLKALAASDNCIPFYVAVPGSTFDFSLSDGVRDIPIETRTEDEVKFVHGLLPDGNPGAVMITPEGSGAANYGFDVTPARLITGLITERGVCEAREEAILGLFPEGA